MACCVLHNIAMERHQPLDEDPALVEIVLEPELPEIIDEPTNHERNTLRKLGFAKRDRVAKSLMQRLAKSGRRATTRPTAQ